MREARPSRASLKKIRVLFNSHYLAYALLAGLLNFIPNIGPTLSVVFPLIVALQDAPWKAIAVIILYIVIQQVESYWVTPAVMAATRLSHSPKSHVEAQHPTPMLFCF